MKIDIDEVSISALRDFGVDQSIILPKNSVVSVIGKNNDDGGSNGTGKSTFAMAVPVNLFGPTVVKISTKSLKNRYLNVPSRIVNKYSIDGTPLIVDRTLGGKFTFKYGENAWEEGKSEDVQERLNNILKITPDQLMFLSNKAQGDIGGFLLMKDEAKKEFLSSLFEVAFVEAMQKNTDALIKTATGNIATASGKISSLTSQIDRLKITLEADNLKLAQFNGEVFVNSIFALESKIASLKGYLNGLEEIMSVPETLTAYVNQLPNIKELKKKNEEQVAELTQKNNELIPDIEKNGEQIQALSDELAVPTPTPTELLSRQTAAINGIMNIKTQRMTLTTLLQKIDKMDWELEDLRKKHQDCDSSACASCGTKLSEDKIATMKKGLAGQLLPKLEARAELAAQAAAIKIEDGAEERLEQEKQQVSNEIAQFKLNNSKAAIEEKLRTLMTSNAALNAAKLANNRTINTLSQALESEIAAAKRALTLNKETVASDMRSVQMEIDGKLRDKQNAEQSVANTAKMLQSLETELVTATAEKEFNEKDLEILKHVDRIGSKNGFIGYLFDSVLEDINSEINKNLKLIPNAHKFSLQLTSDKIAKTTGAVSKTIAYQLFSGKDEVEFNTLSGGEKLSVIIAVDEAVDTVKSRRLGVSVGWKFLDEQFGWIDENSKEAILEFYKLKAVNKTYFVIDHASEFNAALDTKISIIKKNGIATFAELE